MIELLAAVGIVLAVLIGFLMWRFGKEHLPCNHEGKIIPGTSEDIAICTKCKITITIPHYEGKG